MSAVRKAPFFQLPQDHADQYGSVREQSSLGRIFTLANSWHDQIDAVVVIGRHETLSGVRAVIDARCDPFHNELDRAARGSKARMYFATPTSDNDTLAAIMDRVARPTSAGFSLTGFSLTGGPSRFAIVAVIEESDTDDVAALVRWFADRWVDLERSTLDDIKPFVAITTPESLLTPNGLEDLAGHRFEIPAGIASSHATFTPAGLLPMSIRGLNCIKLLEGGLEMAKQLSETVGDQNLACRMSAVQAWARADHRPVVTLSHQESLAGLAAWSDSLFWQSRGSVGATLVLPRDARCAEVMSRGDVLVQRVMAGADRQDGVHLPVQNHAGGKVADRKEERLDEFASQLDSAARWQTELALPSVDMQPMGQWMQSAMTASAMLQQAVACRNALP